jgi:hypothetical protein
MPSELAPLLARAEADARRLAGEGPGLRIAEWKRYAESDDMLVVFIRQKLARRKTFGALVSKGGGYALEHIILENPARFTPHDRFEAERSLSGK